MPFRSSCCLQSPPEFPGDDGINCANPNGQRNMESTAEAAIYNDNDKLDKVQDQDANLPCQITINTNQSGFYGAILKKIKNDKISYTVK